MQKQELQALNNFDFLARSFAHMYAVGHPIDISTITGNMNEQQRIWFCARYDHYRKQAERAKAQALEMC
ncbi:MULTISPECIES: glycogen synthesis protein GlgS [Kluyvera]|uniref:Surface composition regulator n=1 Tax=Kluyvera genomosp. 3 TaxID=2774055 RepID=A0A248KIF0_9ENTR|nr:MULTISPECIES: glycogen synthesis protein GlgS [Kluyvera]ASG63478.1 glycogen synthesis protein GlgS [Kluyvera genomosp. 3]MDA8489867.1 glycogen synthesis protein GlgS [Kluyvera sp. Awk 3]QIR29680.1 glycogen synthesis protein GlgS [Kluyvera genomosp. 3]UAK22711.1 glycogen synthesis protein GlgS [Kluyvera sp. CRP]